ncbi:unnamed protein product [Gadus morhua 'NCC']
MFLHISSVTRIMSYREEMTCPPPLPKHAGKCLSNYSSSSRTSSLTDDPAARRYVTNTTTLPASRTHSSMAIHKQPISSQISIHAPPPILNS